MKEQVELFITFCDRVLDRRFTPQQQHILRRQAAQADLMAELHRAPSPMCPDAIAAQVAEAKARLTKPKFGKEDYTPPRPADWQTAFIITPTVKRRIKEQTNAQHRNHVACQAKGTHKGYGKGGVRIINTIARAAHTRQQIADAISYAR